MSLSAGITVFVLAFIAGGAVCSFVTFMVVMRAHEQANKDELP